jgi:hypothetical protein
MSAPGCGTAPAPSSSAALGPAPHPATSLTANSPVTAEELWGTDITEDATREGKPYCAVVLNGFPH